MLASKFFDDVYYNNAYYARVGGISNVEVTLFRCAHSTARDKERCTHADSIPTPHPQVNSLEMEMLRMISFSLFVQTDQYDRYRASLYSHVGQPGQPATHAAGPGTINPAAAQAVEVMTD